ncbi:uncharacterized protein pon [Eurosta solidaginis]|uniref:uncharacterized protein pon n=1 Tax=Eurosta solidaginis TaxID=178769 RepID=UPI003530FAD2
MPQSSKVNEIAAIGEAVPTLKRKRKSEGYLEQTEVDHNSETKTGFTNAAFSSTPKKATARRRISATITNNYVQNPCLEVKSIADIVRNAGVTQEEPIEKANNKNTPNKNPYEVVRKPPKKKKRETELNEACFENPALNLELPEKQFNPYEVVRALPVKQMNSPQRNCFVNAALNLRTQDGSATLNPFEIQRCASIPVTAPSAGLANPALDEESSANHTALRIALPFKPTLGCRIDFSNIQLEQLTPSKLLADKLVFSPVLAVAKRSLDSASEESSMDIGRELDRYQLELENSINEAKMRKNHGADALEVKTAELTVQVDVEQRVTFTQRLEEIAEEDEEKENESTEEVRQITTTPTCTATAQHFKSEGKANISSACKQLEVLPDSANEDVVYASDSDEDELNFNVPAPFVRGYQRSVAQAPKSTGSKESLNSTASVESESNQHKKLLNVRSIIRKSIRKLIHLNKHDGNDAVKQDVDTNENLLTEKEGIEEKEKQLNSAYKIIRNSLRRKGPTKTVRPTSLQPPLSKTEVSIIDTSERTMKLKAELLPRTDGERNKPTLRSSLRRSTREIGQHFMKTVFHKNQEGYDFSK